MKEKKDINRINVRGFTTPEIRALKIIAARLDMTVNAFLVDIARKAIKQNKKLLPDDMHQEGGAE